MFFDKHKKRLSELRRKMAHGNGDVARLQHRIDKLMARGPLWVVSYYDANGDKREVTCPGKYQSEEGAHRYDILMQEQKPVPTSDQTKPEGEEDPPAAKGDSDDYHATIAQIVDYWLEYRKQKLVRRGNLRAYRAPRVNGEAIKRYLGTRTLAELDSNPDILVNHFAAFPEAAWKPKTVWNYLVDLRSALNRWIRFKRLTHVLSNPCNVVEIQPDINVQEYVPTAADYNAVYMSSYTVGLPDEFRRLLTVVHESGLRINEVLRWQVADLDLCEPAFDAKGNPSKLPSYRTEISKQRKRKVIRVPMSRTLWVTLREQVGQKAEGPVWRWKRPPYNAIKDSGLMAEAGVPYTRPFHDYRKTVKHHLKVELGLPKEVSKGFMGHSSDAMDSYYTHLNVGDLYAAVASSWVETKLETKK